VRSRAARRRAHLTFVAAALALAAFAHCGRKTDVKPPELVAPAVVEDVQASNVGKGIRVSWRRPTRYVDGSTMTDLAGFRLDRSRDGAPFALLSELPVDDRERFRKTRRFRLVDTDVEIGREYRYRVRAFTLDGHESRPSRLATIVRQEAAEKDRAKATPHEPR
jgi:hypothetical protein